MGNTILLPTVTMFLITLAVAQKEALPPTTVVGAGFAPGPQDSIGKVNEGGSPANPFFCPPKRCLYYSGDMDTTSYQNNGLFDFDNPGVADAEVWVGVKAKKNAIITGASGNYVTTATSGGINPTPFAVQTGIAAGHGGKTVCRTGGNAVFNFYGNCSFGINCTNYYISKLKHSCTVKKGKLYFFLIQPQYNDGSTIGYLEDDNGAHANKQGWAEVNDKSYFNSTTFGANYQPSWGTNGACGGIGCDGFSMSLTGKESRAARQ
jgi:hypothetical protein